MASSSSQVSKAHELECVTSDKIRGSVKSLQSLCPPDFKICEISGKKFLTVCEYTVKYNFKVPPGREEEVLMEECKEILIAAKPLNATTVNFIIDASEDKNSKFLNFYYTFKVNCPHFWKWFIVGPSDFSLHETTFEIDGITVNCVSESSADDEDNFPERASLSSCWIETDALSDVEVEEDDESVVIHRVANPQFQDNRAPNR